MTNRLKHLLGGGSHPDLRRPGGWQRVWTLCAVFGLLVVALPATAAELVEVRVGRHPEFTRVVFELDRAAGYRIERTDPSLDMQELVVSLQATSNPHHIESSKSLIEQVDVQPDGSRSIARIRLSTEGLRLKEMILTNPARIVLDVMHDKPVASAPRVAKTTASPAPVKPTERAFEDVVAEIPIETEAPSRVPQVARAQQRVEPAIEKAEPTPVVQEPVAIVEQVVQDEAEAFFGDDPAIADSGEPSTSVPVEEQDVPVEGVERLLAEARMELDTPTDTPESSATPEPSGSRPMVATSTSSEDGGMNWIVWALAGGAFALIGGGILIARRRGSEEVNFEDDVDPFGHDMDADSDTVGMGSDVNPFADVDSEETTALPFATNDGGATVVSPPLGQEADEEKKSESVFDDSEETVMDDMEVISRDQVNESLGGAMPPAVEGAVPEEFQQMMTEMSRRMEALETRCDELVDARDRLERQVAAQTEELRVQRAAIARTQRAVRNLGRPEDGEQEATEPVLRDPNQPASE
jgi:hypothetical protein